MLTLNVMFFQCLQKSVKHISLICLTKDNVLLMELISDGSSFVLVFFRKS